MASASRLVSVVEADGESRAQWVSVAVLHEAELDNGQPALLVDDRGWKSSQSWARPTRRRSSRRRASWWAPCWAGMSQMATKPSG